MEKKAEHRYQSALELAEDLERYLRGETLPPQSPLWSRRRLLLLAGVTAGGAAAVLAGLHLFSSHHPDLTKDTSSRSPEPPLVLIPPIGQPDYFRLLVAQEQASAIPGKRDAPFSFRADKLALVELRANVPTSKFSLEAEVLLGEGGEEKGAGIYFAHSSFPSTRGPCHSYWALSFSESPSPGSGVMRYLAAGRIHGEPPHAKHTLPVTLARPYLAPDAGGLQGRWRKLAVEVTDQQVRASWDNRELAVLSLASVRERTLSVLSGMGIQDADLSPQGGVGLLLYDVRASFRKVILTPLP
jgi:hypothetical protein